MNLLKTILTNNKAKNNLNKMIMINQLKINLPEFKDQINSSKVICNKIRTLSSGQKIQEDFLVCLIFSCLDFTWLKKSKKFLFTELILLTPQSYLKIWIDCVMAPFLSDSTKTLKTHSWIKFLNTLKQSIKLLQFTLMESKASSLLDNFQ